jgi:hypothetical protein
MFKSVIVAVVAGLFLGCGVAQADPFDDLIARFPPNEAAFLQTAKSMKLVNEGGDLLVFAKYYEASCPEIGKYTPALTQQSINAFGAGYRLTFGSTTVVTLAQAEQLLTKQRTLC